MDFWNEVLIKIVILMRKEFDESELLLEKKDKQIYRYCLTWKPSENGGVDKGYRLIFQSDFSKIRIKLRIWNFYS